MSIDKIREQIAKYCERIRQEGIVTPFGNGFLDANNILDMPVSTKPCPECKGSGDGASYYDGATQIIDACPYCKGSGRVPVTLREKLEE